MIGAMNQPEESLLEIEAPNAEEAMKIAEETLREEFERCMQRTLVVRSVKIPERNRE